MIKKLRKKFIITNMALVSVVILCVYVIVCFYNYIDQKNDLYDSLKDVLVQDYTTTQTNDKPATMDKPVDGSASDKPAAPDSATKSGSTAPEESNSSEESAATSESTDTSESVDTSDSTDKEQSKAPVPNRTFTADFEVSVRKHDSAMTVNDNRTDYTEDEITNMVSGIDLNGESHGYLSESDLYYYFKDTNDRYEVVFANGYYIRQNLFELIITGLVLSILTLVVFFFISLFISKLALQPVKEAWTQQKQFVADASHELKTPLTVILANMDILEKHDADTIGSEKKWIESTRETGEYMKQLINEMLILAKTEEAHSYQDKKSIDMSKLVHKCVLQYEVVAFEHKVAFESNIQEELQIIGDETQIRQLVTILIDNGIKYAQENGKVDVRLERAHGFVLFSVTNNGILIPPEKQAHIFDRFYQVETARTVNRDKGFGLGLSIAHNIAGNHKAKIGVISKEETGTKFWVRFDR